MALSEYKSKRDFKKTPEPKGEEKLEKSKQLEFVVQKHDARQLHYDFRLEMGGVLKSWAVPKGPSLNPKDKRLAMMVEDHPFDYRKFEGVIPKGSYGAGNVIIWDKGTYEARTKTVDDEKHLLEKLNTTGHLTFILHGQKLKGEFALVKSEHMGENAWLLLKKKDEFASSEDITKNDTSVVSGQTIDKAGDVDLSLAPKAQMPISVKPMLATLTEEAFDNADWLFEVKWDGYRAIASFDGNKTYLYSRNGNDYSQKYPEIFDVIKDFKLPAVTDGEIVVLDNEGKPHFEWLQNYGKNKKGKLAYIVFDLLWCDGHNLQDAPLSKRKEVLKKIIPNNDRIIFGDELEEQGKRFFELAAKNQLEGIMAKKSDSVYRQGYRSKNWLKIKTRQRQEAVIGGYTEPRGSRKYLGSLVLGIYEGDKLIYIGHSGGGIPDDRLPILLKELEKIEVKNSPFAEKFKPNAPVHWVDPKMIAEVSFGEWTSEGRMRQPIFVGLRDDKDAKQVTKEIPKNEPIKETIKEPINTNVKLSNLNKVFFPQSKITKGDLAEYYKTVAKIMLPYLKDRPHSLLRQPNGINGNAFFQKNMDGKAPDWVKTKLIYSEKDEKDIEYLVPDSEDSLMYMVQLGCIEINPWSSKIEHLDKPDWLVIDLDPEAIGFDKVVETALAAKDILDGLNIPSYPKTSGKTGIHIYIPTAAKYNYDQTKNFAEILANMINQKLPEITSITRDPKKRQGKIYVDYLQNRRGQTLAAPYSVRPTTEASISTPLKWEEVNLKLDPKKFNFKAVLERLNKLDDIWEPVIGQGIDINKILDSFTSRS